jgi:hypothetical protein
LYRCYHPGWIVAALIFGAATFYSYTNGQGVIVVSGVLLLISDWPYHVAVLRDYTRVRWAMLYTIAIVVAPYLRFRLEQPEALAEHLGVMNSIWMREVPLNQKVSVFLGNYLEGISPFYWFSPANNRDIDRHIILGAGNFSWYLAPFGAIGMWHCLRNWRSPAHRAILIAVVAAPFAAALVFIHNYRVLAMVIPATLLFSLGIERLAVRLQQRGIAMRPVGIAVAITLVALNMQLAVYALRDGPRWFDRYGLYGMQYGATQVFPVLAEELDRNPDSIALLSHAWANNPNAFISFFLNDQQAGRTQFVTSDDLMSGWHEIPANSFFVMVADEYQRALASGKFELEEPYRIIPYPNGQPGFYFVRGRYVEDIEAIFAADRERRSRLIDDRMLLSGTEVTVRHSVTDLGVLNDLIDGNDKTLMRGAEANPLVFEFEFAEPREIQGLDLQVWRMDLAVSVIVTPADGGEPQIFSQEHRDISTDLELQYILPQGPIRATKLRVELRDLLAGDVAQIHVQNLTIR